MSLRAHLFGWFLKRQLAKHAGGEFSVESMRRMMDGSRFPLPRGTRREDAVVGGVSGEWVRGEAAGDPHASRRLLYIHGGAFVACSAATHRSITGAFARAGFAVFVPNYALAPEHPFPAGLDDLLAVYRSLVAQGSGRTRRRFRGRQPRSRPCRADPRGGPAAAGRARPLLAGDRPCRHRPVARHQR